MTTVQVETPNKCELSGWFESEDGADHFDQSGADMETVVRELKAMYEDFGDTDMEVTDQDGNDVTDKVYTILETLDS